MEASGPPHAGLPSGKRLVLIVGVPRSGTTWLQLLLSSSPRVATANETYLFSSYLHSAFQSWEIFQRDVRPIGLRPLMTPEEYQALLRGVTDEIFRRIAATKPGADIVLEKTPLHMLHWRNILGLYPDAAFIHIIRDPRAVVASMRAARNDWGSAWVPTTTHGICDVWRRYTAAGREIAGATANYREVHYEALKTDGAKTLSALFDWIGAPVSETECAEIFAGLTVENLAEHRCPAPWDLADEPPRFFRRGEAEGWREELTSAEIGMVEALLRREMNAFGYQCSGVSPLLSPLLASTLLALRLRHSLKWRLTSLSARL